MSHQEQLEQLRAELRHSLLTKQERLQAMQQIVELLAIISEETE